jgi:ADP-L-glycero-D-manno-heptose 6-epimerase
MIVVTGGAGFIGSAIIASLNLRGISDIVVVDTIGGSERWKNLVGKSIADFIHKDLFLQLVSSNALPFTPTAIIHMGACSTTTERDVDYLLENNFSYTKRLAQFCLDSGVRFIYASSAATYGDGTQGYVDDESQLEKLKPLNPYGYSKHLFDLWAKRTGALSSIVGLKFFNVYGPNEYYKGEMASVVFKAFNTIKSTGSFQLFKSHHSDYKDGEQKRDFVYVKDCTDVLWWFLQNPTANGLFNLGSGKARSWNDLITAVCTSMGAPVRISYIDMPESLRAQYQNFTEAPMTKLRAAGYSNPIRSLEEGIKDYVCTHLVAPDKHF